MGEETRRKRLEDERNAEEERQRKRDQKAADKKASKHMPKGSLSGISADALMKQKLKKSKGKKGANKKREADEEQQRRMQGNKCQSPKLPRRPYTRPTQVVSDDAPTMPTSQQANGNGKPKGALSGKIVAGDLMKQSRNLKKRAEVDEGKTKQTATAKAQQTQRKKARKPIPKSSLSGISPDALKKQKLKKSTAPSKGKKGAEKKLKNGEDDDEIKPQRKLSNANLP